MTATDRPSDSLWRAVVRQLSLDELTGLPKPEGIPGGLILPSPPATPPTHAPLGLLNVAQPIPVIGSGPATLPKRTAAQPLDFYGVFLTLKNDFDLETTQDKIDGALAMLPMSEAYGSSPSSPTEPIKRDGTGRWSWPSNSCPHRSSPERSNWSAVHRAW